MNRRELLKGMLAAGLVVPSTKFIFDLGANKRALDLSKYNFIETVRGMFISLPSLNPAYDTAYFEEVLMVNGKIVGPDFPRRFNSELIEIPRFRV